MAIMSTKISFLKKNKKLNQLAEQLKKSADLEVGFLNGIDAKIPTIQEYGAVINVTDKMRKWFLAHGMPLSKQKSTIIIPPRPFMKMTVQKNKNKWKKQSKHLFKQNKTNQQVAGIMGEIIKGDVQEMINEGHFVNNSPATQKLKGRNNPLIDMGHMLNSVDYNVKIK